MKDQHATELVLAIVAKPRGLMFTVSSSPLNLIDWGMRDRRGHERNAKRLEALVELVERYRPAVIVMPECTFKQYRQSRQACRFYEAIESYAGGQGIETQRYSKQIVKRTFRDAGAVTKYEIAKAIAGQIPALSFRLPRKRKPWANEDTRMGVFEATALAMTYYAFDADQHQP